jgi:hypothetical protein
MRFENPEEQALWNRRNPRPGQVVQEVVRKRPAVSRPLPAMLSDVAQAVYVSQLLAAVGVHTPASEARSGTTSAPGTQGSWDLANRSAAVKARLGWVRFEAVVQGRRRGEWAAWSISPKAGTKRKGCNVRKGEKS